MLMDSPRSTPAMRPRPARRLPLLKSSGARQTVICPSCNKFTSNLPQAAESEIPFSQFEWDLFGGYAAFHFVQSHTVSARNKKNDRKTIES